MIKILVADDHTVVRQGIKQILADSYDIVVAAEAETGREVINQLSQDSFDAVLLDIAMPDMSGLDVLREVRAAFPNLPVLVLTIYPEEQYAIRVLRAGASGYLTKDCAADELVGAIRKVANHGKYINPSLAERLAYELEKGREKPTHEQLSDREYQVMGMIASGKNSKDIASELSLSVKTINTYRSRILDKMKLKNNVELTRYAIQHHLVP